MLPSNTLPSVSSPVNATVSQALDSQCRWGEVHVAFDELNQMWSSCVDIHERFVSAIWGRNNGSIQQGKQQSLDTGISISPTAVSGVLNVMYYSRSRDLVVGCITQLHHQVMEIRQRMRPTHFVSVRMVNDKVKERFKRFIDFVLSDTRIDESCKDESLFQIPSKLHVSVVVLLLLDESEEVKAAQILNDVMEKEVRQILNHSELRLEIRGVRGMGDNPAKERIIYAAVTDSRLQAAANVIASAMLKMGLSLRFQHEPVKIHVTLMSTRFCYEKGKAVSDMNVTSLLKIFRDFYFGSVTVNEIQLCRRGTPPDSSGYYESIATMSF
ncbi:hypothetical protein AB6A40_000476 [Gnathostoma spinigerum]|uniref:A-kinase anchor protein 7-like phosphoesterase domain-containing protein n=1 Tax=Gnathostoma spinigerum TaxID=75299 RepID=A0ABD6E492_9BILA